MNILLWILQIALALHTLIGAVWKFSNPEQAVPSLNAIPHSVWLLLSVLEIIAALFLIIPAFKKHLMKLAPIGAAFIILEMAFFCVVQFYSGEIEYSHIMYWLVVAVVAAVIAIFRIPKKG